MARGKSIQLVKADGPEQSFDANKLRTSLLHAGADDELLKIVMRAVRAELKSGDSTDALRRIALGALHREARHIAGRYNLKHAVMKLGPSGYPFERYWGALMEQRGFSVTYDVMLHGRCVVHEVDVVATKAKQLRLAECKFHNSRGARTDIRVALYIYARSLDLRKRKRRAPGRQRFELVTNTRFTSEATRYAKCVKLNLVSWDHPKGGSLRELADRYALYPITCLSTLKARQLKALLNNRVATCRELVEHPELLENLGLTQGQIAAILREAKPLQRIGEVMRRAPEQLR